MCEKDFLRLNALFNCICRNIYGNLSRDERYGLCNETKTTMFIIWKNAYKLETFLELETLARKGNENAFAKIWAKVLIVSVSVSMSRLTSRLIWKLTHDIVSGLRRWLVKAEGRYKRSDERKSPKRLCLRFDWWQAVSSVHMRPSLGSVRKLLKLKQVPWDL